MKKTSISMAVAAAMVASTAQASVYPVDLKSVFGGSSNGTAQGYLTGDTATWFFDTDTNRISQDGGIHRATYFLGVTTIFTHQITGFEIGDGLDAAAASFQCIEGEFGAHVGASICGNYNFGESSPGSPAANESTTTWGPGTAFARTLGGDDIALGPQQNLSLYNGMTTSWSYNEPDNPYSDKGVMVVISSVGFGDEGYEYTFNSIPVPPAVWLFGSALGVLGWLRRCN